jgi:hypothetical protein
MKAGRELDALVAKKVFGAYLEEHDSREPWNCDVCGKPFYSDLPPYSTDIAAAWLVAEKADLFGRKMLVLSFDGERWIISDEVTPAGPHGVCARAETVPLVLCLAALKAVE